MRLLPPPAPALQLWHVLLTTTGQWFNLQHGPALHVTAVATWNGLLKMILPLPFRDEQTETQRSYEPS